MLLRANWSLVAIGLSVLLASISLPLASFSLAQAATRHIMIDEIIARGHKALDQGQLQQAGAAFRKALQDLNLLPEAHFGLAKLYRRQGRRSQAEEQLRTIINTDPTYDQAWLELADLYSEHGYTSEAVELLQTFVRYNPFNADREHNLAVLLEKQGRGGLSFHHYENADLLAPRR